MAYDDLSFEDSQRRADEKGQKIVIPTEHELFVDIDNNKQLEIFYQQSQRIKKYLDFTYEVKPSSSGEEGHCHIYCKLSRPVDEKERILLQLLLGSDSTREYLGWARITQGDPYPTLFFEKKDEEPIVVTRALSFED